LTLSTPTLPKIPSGNTLRVELHYAKYGITVEITGLNARSQDLHRNLFSQPVEAH
jgi:hypothetical protein